LHTQRRVCGLVVNALAFPPIHKRALLKDNEASSSPEFDKNVKKKYPVSPDATMHLMSRRRQFGVCEQSDANGRGHAIDVRVDVLRLDWRLPAPRFLEYTTDFSGANKDS
jgi:hypothetical protein